MPQQARDLLREDLEAAWAAEIQRRADAVRAGEVESTDWRTVLDRIELDVLQR